MPKKDLAAKMNEIGDLRNKVQKLKDFIDQENASKNLRFTFGANTIDFKDSEFKDNYLNKVAESILKKLNKDIENLNSKLNNS
ncbi:MAG: hypothetical protein ACR2NW_08930 [Thermodesulfobacteriota bacterium]